ncbi:MAG: hypothetical protein ACKO6F_03000 [Cyanobium sp.]
MAAASPPPDPRDPWLDSPPAPCFYEVFWHGEGIGDGGDPGEALLAYAAVRPEDGDWERACAEPGADPHLERHASFEAYLDNADALERLPVSAAMIAAALDAAPG